MTNSPQSDPWGGAVITTDAGTITHDQPPGYLSAALECLAEAADARAKFPPFNSAHEGYAVIAEEVDEMWDEVKSDDHRLAIAEALQVGAMAIRFVADMRAKYPDEVAYCPACGADAIKPHSRNCHVAAALREAKR